MDLSRTRAAVMSLTVAVAAAVGTAQASATTGPTLVPTVDCVSDQGEGLYVAYFGYVNSGASPINYPVGDSNLFNAGSENQGQPTSFSLGTYPTVVAAYFAPSNGETSVGWVLDGSVATASASSPACSAGSTGSASALTPTSATLSGLVDPFGAATYSFEWGTSDSTLQSTPTETLDSPDPELVSAELTGLTPGTTYVYELVADNGRASTTGAEQTFTTPAAAADGATTGITTTPPPTTTTTPTTTTATPPVSTGSTQTPAMTLDAPADLTLTAHSSATRALPGRSLRYVLTVANRGLGAATRVVVHLALPRGLRLKGVAGAAHHCTGTTLLGCQLGTVAAGETDTLTLTVVPRADVSLRTLVFLTTGSANLDTTGDVVTLRTAAGSQERGSAETQRTRDESLRRNPRAARRAAAR